VLLVVVPPVVLDVLVLVVCAVAAAVTTRMARPMAILVFIFSHLIIIILIFIALEQRNSGCNYRLSKSMTFHGNIIFPEGAGGNHLRWLLFLDSRYQDPFNNYTSPDSKVKFILENVYTQNRTWNTWLQQEWFHRPMLDGQINISHDCKNWIKIADQRSLFITFENYELPLTHYYHINIGLNSSTPDQFRANIRQRQETIEHIQKQANSNFKFLQADCIFAPELDVDFYNQLVSTFGFDNVYEHAAQVHRAYALCRQRSVRDFCSYFDSKEFAYFRQQLLEITR